MDPTAAEAARRRTFAVISHPDAGRTFLTEAFALHAAMIAEAGAIHGKAGRRGTVSDWMEIERDRGISITSATLQFTYGDTVINLVDTPAQRLLRGHLSGAGRGRCRGDAARRRQGAATRRPWRSCSRCAGRSPSR